jgi:hypothetical protein
MNLEQKIEKAIEKALSEKKVHTYMKPSPFIWDICSDGKAAIVQMYCDLPNPLPDPWGITLDNPQLHSR